MTSAPSEKKEPGSSKRLLGPERVAARLLSVAMMPPREGYSMGSAAGVGVMTTISGVAVGLGAGVISSTRESSSSSSGTGVMKTTSSSSVSGPGVGVTYTT